jgi:hypothetical protein
MCVCARDSSTIKIKLEFVYICVRDNDFTPVSTILPLYIAVIQLIINKFEHHGYHRISDIVNSGLIKELFIAQYYGNPTY